MPAIFLSHAADARAHYYGDEALARLRDLGEVRLNETGRPLATAELVEQAAGCAVIVSDRQTTGPAEVFAALPELAAFLRCAMDIRNIDVAAASKAGVLVTRATAGFIDAVAELGIGLMVDLARGVSVGVQAYRAGTAPAVRMGVQLSRSSIGIIGYGGFGRFLHYWFNQLPNVEVIAVADHGHHTKDTTACHVYANWKDLLNDPAIEIVSIVTPPALHAQMACAAMQAGKHVMLEKPVALSEESAQQILAIQKETGMAITVNHMIRYNPIIQTLTTIGQSGILGKLRFGRAETAT